MLSRWRLPSPHGWCCSGAGGVPLPVRLSEVLFTGPHIRTSATDLRQHHWRPTRQLHLRRTVDATVRRAGLVTPVWRERRQLPEYVFMIEQNGANDHLARLFDLAVERLRDEHVFIQRYYFHTDPRQLQSDDAGRSPVPLAELAARTDDHRLFVIATADGFFHPLTGDVESWVGHLDPWRSRTLMSTKPLEQWGLAELRLLEEGFSLATAEVTGFAAVGEKVAVGDDKAELLEGVVVAPPPRPVRSPPAPSIPIVELPDLAVFRDVDAPWPAPQHLRVFISSPDDVADERNLARRLLKDELPYDPFLRGKVTFDPVSWDDPAAPTPMVATLTPQEAVKRFGCRPSECDIVIVVLWSRLGTHLDLSKFQKPNGEPYLSGTEYEYEDAASAEESPDILVYRRIDKILIDADDPKSDDKREQYRKAQAFFDRFKNHDGLYRGGFTDYATPTDFLSRLEKDLKAILQKRLKAAPSAPPAEAVVESLYSCFIESASLYSLISDLQCLQFDHLQLSINPPSPSRSGLDSHKARPSCPVPERH